MIPLPQIRNELTMKFDELKTSSAERIDILTSMLDSAQTTPELLALYESISTKLSSRVPIVQVSKCGLSFPFLSLLLFTLSFFPLSLCSY
jgi:hypothetical protein